MESLVLTVLKISIRLLIVFPPFISLARGAFFKRVKENTANAVQKKTACGEFKNVLLTKNEFEKLESQYPQEFDAIIDYLSSYIEMKGYKAKSHYLAIQKWVVLAYREQKKREENLIRGEPRKVCTEYPE